MPSFSALAKPGIDRLHTYEAGRPIDEVARDLGISSTDAITKLASNENALGPSRLALEAMRLNTDMMHLYPDGGAYRLRKALAVSLDVEMDQVLPANGSNEILEFLGHVFLGPGTSIVMAEYAFVVYRLIAATFDSDVIDVPMREFRHDLKAMCDAIRKDTRIVFIANPNNPTGTRVTTDEIDQFMNRVPDNVIVCFDEAYIELLPPAAQSSTLAYVRDGRNVITMRTFSKTYGLAGLRIGYAVAPSECISLLNRVRQPFNVNAMAQAAAIAALGDKEHVDRTRTMVAEGIAMLQAAFESMSIDYVPSCVNFILVRVGDSRRVFDALMQKGIIVRPMDGYKLPEYIRVTVGTLSENERFVTALGEVLST